jgi:hypothetical protein
MGEQQLMSSAVETRCNMQPSEDVYMKKQKGGTVFDCFAPSTFDVC